MSIYLAWSLYKLVITLLVVFIACSLLWYAGHKQTKIKSYKKAVLLIGFIWTTFALIAAFNIGDRQQHLHRSDFNATFPDLAPNYVPPPPDRVKSAREDLEKNIIILNSSIKEKTQ